MNLKQRLESFGYAVVPLIVDGIDYLATANREAGTVELYEMDGDLLAEAELCDGTECCYIKHYHINRDHEIIGEDSESSADLYFQNEGKTEHDLAEDIGSWLAATTPF